MLLSSVLSRRLCRDTFIILKVFSSMLCSFPDHMKNVGCSSASRPRRPNIYCRTRITANSHLFICNSGLALPEPFCADAAMGEIRLDGAFGGAAGGEKQG